MLPVIRRLQNLLLPVVVAASAFAAPPPELAAPIAALRNVGPEGRGNVEAAKAWRELANRGGADLPVVLEAMNGANDLARNWLRAAAESIVARETAAGRSLPVPELESFLTRPANDPRARRFAYDLIARADAPRAEKLITGMLDDPATELRRDAVQRVIDEAAASRAGQNTNDARVRYQTALKAARDVDQIDATAKALRELGEVVSLPEVFGWVTRWQVVGPFDNTQRAGYDTVFAAEAGFRPDAEYDGKTGKVRWQTFTTTNDYGMVDLNKPLGALKEVTAYAHTDFVADRAQPAELRLGCKNAWKVWFNGQFLFGRDEYHRGAEIDQYRLPVQLKPGTNSILVKVCQNEQTEDWTVEWEFQLRLTDLQGKPLRPAASATH